MATTVTLKTQDGTDAGELTLASSLFDTEPNIAVMHQVVTAQLAAKRAGTHSTKRRSEVRGGGAKPWRQKGTGRARAGSRNSPIWRGGGVAHGPKPRDYSQRTPKKMIKLALAGALSDRANEGNIIVVDEWNFETPKTKDAVAALDAIGASGKVLVVLDETDINVAKSFRNLTHVSCLHFAELNTHDVLDSEFVVFTEATLNKVTKQRGEQQ
ncbi:MAG: 50S ribosomal protein L4 [Acidimicrobiia bacterium]|nr:50S ribosomal protein L4 [Acidimicrobiia bacterium]MCY4457865.1 50S ribosomal protein L4 [Acidimicrobiaceae bacterium]